MSRFGFKGESFGIDELRDIPLDANLHKKVTHLVNIWKI
jgi:hypothetical protein